MGVWEAAVLAGGRRPPQSPPGWQGGGAGRWCLGGKWARSGAPRGRGCDVSGEREVSWTARANRRGTEGPLAALAGPCGVGTARPVWVRGGGGGDRQPGCWGVQALHVSWEGRLRRRDPRRGGAGQRAAGGSEITQLLGR